MLTTFQPKGTWNARPAFWTTKERDTDFPDPSQAAKPVMHRRNPCWESRRECLWKGTVYTAAPLRCGAAVLGRVTRWAPSGIGAEHPGLAFCCFKQTPGVFFKVIFGHNGCLGIAPSESYLISADHTFAIYSGCPKSLTNRNLKEVSSASLDCFSHRGKAKKNQKPSVLKTNFCSP